MIRVLKQQMAKKGQVYEKQALHSYYFWKLECERLGLINITEYKPNK